MQKLVEERLNSANLGKNEQSYLFWLQLVERNLKVGSQSNSAPDFFLDENHPEISQIEALTAFWYE